MVWAIVLVPAIAGIIALGLPGRGVRYALIAAVALAHAGLTAAAWFLPRVVGPDDWLAIGPSALYLLTVTSLLFLLTAPYVIGYLHRRGGEETPPRNGHLHPEAVFVGCLLFFLASMSLVIVSQHIGVLWVAVEATTLVSAPLIYFHGGARSLEATWKYLLICSVGIALALLGTFFLTISASFGDAGEVPLTVQAMSRLAPTLHPVWLKAAFILLLVGYGTKIGLVPLHTWLPDAHSEAPSPVSALLSGALLNCAFLALLRVGSIMIPAGLADFSNGLLVGFGLLTVIVAAALLIRQNDYKRLLAYSSVENMGLMVIGAGIGGIAGTGALVHAANHSFAKALLFLAAGNLLATFGTKQATLVTAALRRTPWSASLWIAGMFAITGTPPFGTFVGKVMIIRGALLSHRYAATAVVLAALAAAFAGMSSVMIRMVFSPSADDIEVTRQKEPFWSIMPPLLFAVLAIGATVALPAPVAALIDQAAAQLGISP